jgi:hypothetical protein
MASLGLGKGDAAFFVAGDPAVFAKFAGLARTRVGTELKLVDEDQFRFCWIVDFPMFEWSEEEKKVDFSHNPFSMPQGGLEALESQDPLTIRAYQYDIVCNGYELCSGAIRNHKPEIMLKAFEIAGYGAEVVEEQFGGMLNAFRYRRPAARRPGPRHRPDRHAAGRPGRHPRGHRLPAEPAGPGPADERPGRGGRASVQGTAHPQRRPDQGVGSGCLRKKKALRSCEGPFCFLERPSPQYSSSFGGVVADGRRGAARRARRGRRSLRPGPEVDDHPDAAAADAQAARQAGIVVAAGLVQLVLVQAHGPDRSAPRACRWRRVGPVEVRAGEIAVPRSWRCPGSALRKLAPSKNRRLRFAALHFDMLERGVAGVDVGQVGAEQLGAVQTGVLQHRWRSCWRRAFRRRTGRRGAILARAKLAPAALDAAHGGRR